jgi:hypothetical protein
MSLPCRRDIGSSYVSPLSVRQVVVMFPLVDETKVVVKVETKLLPMSGRQGGDKTTTYVLPTRLRQNYYLCLTDKVETKLLPMYCLHLVSET